MGASDVLGVLGAPWEIYGGPWGVLGAPWGSFGGSLGFLGEPWCIGFEKVLRLATGSILLEGFVAAGPIPTLRAWGSLRDPGAPWGVPGRSLGILGRSSGSLGDPWGVPGRSLGDPGCSLAFPGWSLGGLQMLPGRLPVAQGRSKKHSKNIGFCCIFKDWKGCRSVGERLGNPWGVLGDPWVILGSLGGP